MKGLLASVGAGTALVTLATPEETQALQIGQPTLIGQPPALPKVPNIGMFFENPLCVRNAKGEYVEVGWITNLSPAPRDIDMIDLEAPDYIGDARITHPRRLYDAFLSFEGRLK